VTGVGIVQLPYEHLPFGTLKLTQYRLNVLCPKHFVRAPMTKLPFEKQYLTDPVERIKLDRAQGVAVSGDALLDAIEWSLGHRLVDSLREEVSKFSVPAVNRRGRPRSNNHLESLALGKVNARYPALLRKYEENGKRQCSAAGRVVPAKAEPTPSELAYTELLREMPKDFLNISWQALRNAHSAWKCAIADSEDYDAEIERLHPVPPDS
jgi:hypothetical protein